jgi:hypothetical protein
VEWRRGGWAAAAGPRSLSLKSKDKVCFRSDKAILDRKLKSGFGCSKRFPEAQSSTTISNLQVYLVGCYSEVRGFLGLRKGVASSGERRGALGSAKRLVWGE